DLGGDLLPFLHDLRRVLHISVGELAEVNEAFEAVLDLRKCTELCKLCNGGGHNLTDAVLLLDCRPWIGECPLQAQCDLFAVAIHAEHRHVDFLADMQDFAWMIDARMRELRNVDKAIGTAEVDEGPEARQVTDDA